MKTGSKTLIRSMNRSLVLTTIMQQGPLSRADAAKITGLTKATISAIVQELIDNDYIREIGWDNTSQGRKPILLEFCRQNGNIISLDISSDGITLMICDLLGQNCRLHQYRQLPPWEDLIPYLEQILRTQIAALPKTPFGVPGIGIGIHGVVKENNIVFTPNYPLAGMPIAETLQQRLGIPVYLENEANLAAIAEETFGSGDENLIQVSIHGGVGAGIIIHHQLYTGILGNAGEFGHMVVEPDGLPCGCGNRGCLEQYISDHAILRDYQDRLVENKKGSAAAPTMNDLVAAYVRKEAEAQQTVDRFCRYLSYGIHNLWMLFSPSTIIVNSPLTTYLPELLPRIREHMLPRFRESCRLTVSDFQDTAVLLGGARICMQGFFDTEEQLRIKP